MDVRSQIAMVFHLDKCIGCHTCSIACKNVWTDRKGAEYMWWNNVETKPGTGYPTCWEDQSKYSGGWERNPSRASLRQAQGPSLSRTGPNGNGTVRLKSTDKARSLPNIFHHPRQPSMDDYYEPWTYKYGDLFNAPEGTDQPTARPISMVTGEHIDIKAGPNWDDDLGGSPIYAQNDPNLDALTPEQRQQLFAIERLVFFYFPRICNHCTNPACVAACPSGALYKRGEDGIVLIDQKRCRGWRACVAACPYKKSFYNWQTGKSEKCILCYPRIETGQAPACFHSCVGRIRYLGVLLYDASRIEEVANSSDADLIEAQRSMILDPFDPAVAQAARDNGIHESVIESARQSPIYAFVKVWKLALPPHIEYRTLPMLFYVPPLSPVMASQGEEDAGTRGRGDAATGEARDPITHVSKDFFHDIDESRVPMAFLAKLFGAGHEGQVRYALRKQKAVRVYRRAMTVGDVDTALLKRTLEEADCTPEEAEEIYRLTSLCTFNDRFVIPPSHREQAIEALQDPLERKQAAGFGFVEGPVRGA